MFANTYHPPGTAPATLIPRGDRKPVITLTQYNKDSIEKRTVENVDDLFTSLDSGKTNWIDIDGLADVDILSKLGEAFGLHPLALEDVIHAPQRPKVEEFERHFFIVAQIPFWNAEKGVTFEQVSLFFAGNFLITLQENPQTDVFESVHTRLRTGRGFGRTRGHDYLVYALLDSVVDRFFPALESMGEVIEDLEEELLDQPTRSSLIKLHEIKRELMMIRRNIWPVRELFTSLIRDESGLVTHETTLFLRDCYDHTIRLMDVIENYRDLTASMMDIYLSSVGMRTNEIMRVLTLVSTVFIPLTFIAGVYGMNFESIPGLKSPTGFVVCIGSMLALATGMLGLFRYKKWI
ncbi:MAG: magnesium/cobalt transporter CorA [Verrucomicrobiota bacterium]